MGTKFSKLWNDPAFIDSSQKVRIESEAAAIGKLIETRESENLQKLKENSVDNNYKHPKPHWSNH